MTSLRERVRFEDIFTPKVRLAVSAALFLGWVGYLGWLAVSTARPVVLSRAQLLASTLDVIAEVEAAPDGRPRPVVMVREVAWPAKPTTEQPGRLTIANLEAITSSRGWKGPGVYILPLVKEGQEYRVAPVPRSPGFDDPAAHFIYPLTDETREQLRQAPKPAS